MTRLLDLLKGLIGLALIVALLAGIPALLLLIVGYPLPTRLPSTEVIRAHIEDGDIPDAFLIKTLALVVWFVWAQLAVATVVELVAVGRGRLSGRAPVLPGVQAFAGKLVASTVLIVSAFAPSRTMAAAPIAAPDAAELAVDAGWSGDEPNGSAGDGVATGLVSTMADLQPHRFDAGGGAMAKAAGPGFYTTRSGDSWWDVAERLLGDGMRWSELRALNSGRTMLTGEVVDDRTEAVRAGWNLHVPNDADPALLDHGDDRASAAGEDWSLVQALRPGTLVYEGPSGAERVGRGPAYQVVEGDNLWDIAERHLGDPFRWPEIFEASNDLTQTFGRRITDPNLIWPDSVLVLPDDAVDVPAADPDLVSEVLGRAGPTVDERPEGRPADDGPTAERLHELAERAAEAESAALVGPADTGVDEAGADRPLEVEPVHPAEARAGDPTGPGGPDGPGGGQDRPDDAALPAGALAVAGGGALLATGLLGLLGRARRLRLAEIGEASMPAPPPLQLVDIETVLRNRSDRRAVDALRLAIASLGAGTAGGGGRADEPAPIPEVVRIRGGRVEAIVADTGQGLPTPWQPVPVTGGSLPPGRLAAVADPAALEAITPAAEAVEPAPRPDLAPTLVTVGDGLLVNLEAAGVVGIVGRPDTVAALLRTIVHELDTAPINGLSGQPVDVLLSDRLPDIGLHPGIRPVPADRLVGELQPRLEQIELRLAASGAADPWGLRLVDGSSPVSRPIVVVVDRADLADGAPAAGLLRLAGDRRLPVAVIAIGSPTPDGVGPAGPTATPSMTVMVDADVVRLEPLGLAAPALDLELDLVLGAEALIDHARRAPIVPRPELSWAESELEGDPGAGPGGRSGDHASAAATDPAQLPTEETPEHEIVTERPSEDEGEDVTDRSDEEESGLLIRVLGPVEVEGGPTDLPETQVAILAFLALAGPSTVEQIVEAIAPGRPAERAIIEADLAELGERLGPLFPQAGDGRHRVRSTITDLGSARRWVAQAGALTEERARNLLQLALSEVRGRPFAGVSDREWQWVEDHRLAIATQATSLLMDACFDLCDSAYGADDFHLALWACGVGSTLDPLNETAVTRQVQLLSVLDRGDEAAGVVDRWEAAFLASAGRPAPHGPRLALGEAVGLPTAVTGSAPGPAPVGQDEVVATHVG